MYYINIIYFRNEKKYKKRHNVFFGFFFFFYQSVSILNYSSSFTRLSIYSRVVINSFIIFRRAVVFIYTVINFIIKVWLSYFKTYFIVCFFFHLSVSLSIYNTRSTFILKAIHIIHIILTYKMYINNNIIFKNRYLSFINRIFFFF